MLPYQLTIFDFDGTLADTFPWFFRALNDAAPIFGYRTMTEAELPALRGFDNRKLIRHFGLPMWKLPMVARHLRKAQAQSLHELRLFPGVADMLRDVAGAGVRVAIVSSNAEANIRRILGAETAGLISHFGCGASLFGKAAKFRTILGQSGVDPSRAIAIGDEIRDIEAARTVGIASGAVAWGFADFNALTNENPTEAFRTVADLHQRLIGAAP